METAFRSDERFTQAEFREWLERLPGSDINHYELLGGAIVMTPPAGWRHASTGARLGALLGPHVSRLNLGIVFDATAGFELPTGDTLEPDLSFVSAERWTALAPERDGFLPLVPNFVVEIQSPSTARRDRTEKLDAYRASGVDEYWIVSTKERYVEVYAEGARPLDGPTRFVNRTVSAQAVPGFQVSLEELFEPLGPR